jgi:DNA helicase-2/ATP-dependent DNA helicase PcrA
MQSIMSRRIGIMGTMEITDKDIQRVEKLLLPTGCEFDQERREVIKCLETKDIKACPGSSKTTTLIVKLMILAERMPFEDGRGICVLTHTNVAIDKIKEKLGSKSDILFSYPNHFGTFQSFVDKFLAIPAYKAKYCQSIIKIDDDRSSELIERYYNSHKYFKLRKFVEERFKWMDNPIDVLKKLRFRPVDFDIVKCLDGDLFIKEKKSDALKQTKEIKDSLLKKGYLFFDDAYSLALWYLDKYPELCKAFSYRFKYVFIDEMQDTDVHQEKIINMLFDETVVVQKFGDPHQSIYDISVKKEEVWKPGNYLVISESKRFGDEIAKRLRTICIEPNEELKGNSQVNSLIPHIIVFDDKAINNNNDKTINNKVIETFADLIHRYKLDERQDDKEKLVFKAVGWVGRDREKGEEHKLNLGSYFRDYKKIIRDYKKANFKNLKSYLRKQSPETVKKHGAKVYFDTLLNAFVKILYDSGVKNTSGNRETHFTPSTLLSYLKENKREKHDEFRTFLEKWFSTIQNSEWSYCFEVLQEIRKYVRETFAKIWENFEYEKVKEFMEDEETEIKDDQCKNNNFFRKTFEDTGTEVEIEVATIHSIKGENHKATLYLETYMGKGLGSSAKKLAYESQKIINFIIGKNNEIFEENRKKGYVYKALKMAYVGMSRPTHLLCLAMHKARIEGRLNELDGENNPNGWKIIDLTNNNIEV